MSERSRVSLFTARTRARISRIAATTEKPSSASAVASTAISWRLRPKKVEIECSTVANSLAVAIGASARAPIAASPSVDRPPRTNEVHDSKVRRIATITPDDMVCPKPHNSEPGERSDAKLVSIFADRASVRESSDNIPNGSRPVRVQIVNAKLHREKIGINFTGRGFMKMNRYLD